MKPTHRAGRPTTGDRPRTLLEAIEAGPPPAIPGLERDPGAMSERELEGHVRRIWKDLRTLGLDIIGYHTHRSDRSEPGYPDWTFVGRWLMFRELKKANGRVSPDQKIWLTRLQSAGVDADIWRPADLTSGRIARELTACAKGTPR